MTTLYLDNFSGISGDMFLGALIDLGLDQSQLESQLQRLGVGGYHLHVVRDRLNQIEGIRFSVHCHPAESNDHTHSDPAHGHSHPSETRESPHEHGRSFAEIRNLIRTSPLSEWVKQKSIAVFERIAVAEGRIHGRPADTVHFHEVGAVDSIVDIVGACVALEMLDKPRVLAGPIVDGTGWIECAHGRLPLPAPATLAILGARGVAITQCSVPTEMVTPTGAALMAEFVEHFGPMSSLVASKIGYGLGSRVLPDRPNVLRVVLSEALAAVHDWEVDQIGVLETNIDDLNAEVLGHFVDLALSQGALDVFHTAVQMKKNRPAVKLTVLCGQPDMDRLTELILLETSAFGVRRHVVERRKLVREFAVVDTPFGPLKVKLGKLDGQVVQASPEYESCKMLAQQAGVPLKQIYEFANDFYHENAQL
jgi:hypothetical protein